MKKVLILGNENERASIACLRALCDLDVEVYLAFWNNSVRNRVIFCWYRKRELFFYNTNSKEEFIISLIRIQEKIGEYYLIILGDLLMRWAIESKSLLLQKGIEFKAPDLKAFNFMFNKSSFVEWSAKFGLDIPEEVPAKQYLEKKSFVDKFVIKARSNVATNGGVLKAPVLIENRKAFLNLEKLDLNLDMHFIQKYISGPSIYYCAYYEGGDRKVYFVQKNICQQPGGKSIIKAIPYRLPEETIRKIDDMMRALNWEGVMMIELKQSQGKFYAIECNSRLWGPLQLSIDNGINFPAYVAGVQQSNEHNIVQGYFGFIWLTGYLLGLAHKFITKTDFQFYEYEQDRKIVFKDIWLRRDTFSYFFLEAFFTFMKLLRGKII